MFLEVIDILPHSEVEKDLTGTATEVVDDLSKGFTALNNDFANLPILKILDLFSTDKLLAALAAKK